jgi:hypothetical protein
MALSQPAIPTSLPWDQGRLSFSALAQTWVMVTFRPGHAFSLPMGGQWKRWLLFAIIINGVAMLGTWFLVAMIRPSISPIAYLEQQGFLLLLYLIVMVYQAGLINVLIKFITRTHASFQTALRAACYSQSVMLFLLLQILSGPSVLMICFFWNIALMTIGTKHSYQVSTRRAVAVNIIYAVLTIFVQWVLLTGQS